MSCERRRQRQHLITTVVRSVFERASPRPSVCLSLCGRKETSISWCSANRYKVSQRVRPPRVPSRERETMLRKGGRGEESGGAESCSESRAAPIRCNMYENLCSFWRGRKAAQTVQGRKGSRRREGSERASWAGAYLLRVREDDSDRLLIFICDREKIHEAVCLLRNTTKKREEDECGEARARRRRRGRNDSFPIP